MISRRVFLGTMAALAAVPPVMGVGPAITLPPLPRATDGQPTDVPFNGGAAELVTEQHYARLLFRAVARDLRDLPMMVVGGPDSRLGSRWGSGIFHEQAYLFVPDIPYRETKVVLDRLALKDMASKYAALLRERGYRYTGNLTLPAETSESLRVSNHRLSMRYVSVYDVCGDYLQGRFDVLGGRDD